MKLVLGKLEPCVPNKDVDNALEVMYISGNNGNITFEEFSAWLLTIESIFIIHEMI